MFLHRILNMSDAMTRFGDRGAEREAIRARSCQRFFSAPKHPLFEEAGWLWGYTHSSRGWGLGL